VTLAVDSTAPTAGSRSPSYRRRGWLHDDHQYPGARSACVLGCQRLNMSWSAPRDVLLNLVRHDDRVALDVSGETVRLVVGVNDTYEISRPSKANKVSDG
jgi:hypothetical protein